VLERPIKAMSYRILCTTGDKSPIREFGAYRASFQATAVSSDQGEEAISAYDGIDRHITPRELQVLLGRSCPSRVVSMGEGGKNQFASFDIIWPHIYNVW